MRCNLSDNLINWYVVQSLLLHNTATLDLQGITPARFDQLFSKHHSKSADKKEKLDCKIIKINIILDYIMIGNAMLKHR